ncbi:hypothetical protein TPSD3_08900 [Thioflexithrix psekupsensis]|uniref:DUF1566 domain-containing protein n=1 Tax=Thioflexithrix psekupsensis TaxID=1570016 RepID=A0A251X9K9_9GAMM|nr:hypothetical protein TPSD3_08900 [Thioflexithrix psekupsensis]
MIYCSSGKPAYFPNNGEGCKGSYQRPTLVQEVFPDSPASVVWSGSPVSDDSRNAWNIDFGDGHECRIFRSFSRHVRLVRGGQ